MASLHEDRSRTGHQVRRMPRTEASPLRMARLIEGEIIPRLLLAHRVAEPAMPRVEAPAVAPGDSVALAQLTLCTEVYNLVVHIEAFLAKGITIDTVYLDLLAPAARTLGDFWDQDICDFVDVTMGLWRLQQVVHEFGSRAPCPSVRTRANRRALFTVPPGSQHSFGLVMIEDFFRRGGWRTWSAPDAGMRDLCAIVGRQWFEVIGLTVSNDDEMARLPAIIADLRRASQNPAVAVMVGGRIFSECPERAAETGADATAADGPSALRLAETLVERAGSRTGG